MKKATVISFLLMSLAADAIFAEASNSRTVHLTHALQVGTADIPEGIYRLTWTGGSKNTEVTFTRHTPAYSVTIPVRIVPADNSVPVSQTDDGVIVDSRTEAGKRILVDIRLSHMSLLFLSSDK